MVFYNLSVFIIEIQVTGGCYVIVIFLGMKIIRRILITKNV